MSLALGLAPTGPQLDSLQKLQAQTELNCFSRAQMKDAQVSEPRSEGTDEDEATEIKLLRDLGRILPSL